jgi:hypothetical protein
MFEIASCTDPTDLCIVLKSDDSGNYLYDYIGEFEFHVSWENKNFVFSNPEALTRKYTLTIVDVCPEVVGGEWPLKSEIVPTILQLDEILVIPISDLL